MYKYDVFFSYRRHPESDEWHRRVKDKLAYWLEIELGKDEVPIFFDTQEIHSGEQWRERLAEALRSSKAMVCFWSPVYFKSQWCVSEWKTFAKREELFGKNLVVPASYHDGERFPPKARDKQKLDISDFTSTAAQFWNTERADRFEEKCLKPFAKDIAALIRKAPPFDPGFPLEEARPEDLVEAQDVGRPGDA
jgi:hypothetical protein